MKEQFIREVQHAMIGVLDQRQQEMLKTVLLRCLEAYSIEETEQKQTDGTNRQFGNLMEIATPVCALVRNDIRAEVRERGNLLWVAQRKHLQRQWKSCRVNCRR